MRIITLLTDYGLEDNFVGVMKGVILGINPKVRIVDISHNVRPQDILKGAFLLKGSYRFFPKGSIHLAVVDPGVGSSRKGVIVKTRDYIFVGPDNGVLGLALEDEKVEKIIHIANDKYFLNTVSNTFHGRDIFAPVVGYLSKGVSAIRFGRLIDDYTRLKIPEVKGSKGEIIYIDHFGNLITNINKCSRLRFKGRTINKISSSYADVKRGSPLAIFSSFGFMEISVREGSAEDYFHARVGDIVKVN